MNEALSSYIYCECLSGWVCWRRWSFSWVSLRARLLPGSCLLRRS